jgi:DNA recombination protein RmuC
MELYWIIALALFMAGVGGLLGWLIGGRGAAALTVERDLHLENFKRSISDLSSAVKERDEARMRFAALEAEQNARESGFEERLAELREAKDALSAQFSEIGGKLLGQAQQAFLERADARFKQSEATSGQELKALLQPVTERLQRYEEAVTKVEAERREAFGNLHGLMESMRVSNESVRAEAAKLGNSLRNAPKARGRWGEQQLKNVLEMCGLAEHTDFQTEVSVDAEEGRLRPDAIVLVPGGRALVIDAKVSLNAYQDAFGATDERERAVGLTAHAAAMKAHVNTLGAKAYWSQFEAAPDYVIMFVPGEHFLTAALETDHSLWDYAFEKKVLLATPTNLIAIARTVSAVWRQESLAKEARQIGELGKELHDRLAVAAGHLRTVGGGLSTAVNNYNKFVGSFERNILSTGRKFKELNIETGARAIEEVPVIEALARYGEESAALIDASNDAKFDVKGA